MRALFLTLALFLILFSLPQTTFAQQNNLTLTPSIMQLDLATDPAEYQITYTNNSSSTIELNFSAEDFSSLEDGWRVNFLEEKDAQNYKFSLASWISFDRTSLTLAPQESQKLKISIDKDRLSPGGHYGSILARVSLPGSNTGDVKIDTILSSLLFVRNNSGSEIEQASISDISFNQNWFNFPSQASLKIQNTGNTHLTPYGRINIYDPLGNLVAKGIVNEGSFLSLPETVRKFDIKLQNLSPFLMPGQYKAVVTLHWGKNQTEIYKEAIFLSFGNLTPVISGVIVIALLLLRLLIKKKKTN